MINDTAKQQNVDDLSRDVEHANQTLSPIFDKEKEQQRMQTLQLIGEIGNQAADIARTQGDIAGFTAAKAKYPTYTDKQLRETVEFKQASHLEQVAQYNRPLPPQPPQYKDWREGISLRR